MVMENGTDTARKPAVLIVAPNNEEGRSLQGCLNSANGFEALTVSYEAAARTDLRDFRPQLVVLVLEEDQRRGFLALKQLRHLGNAPLVLVSKNGGEEDIIRGFQNGASDYLVIPLDPPELTARLHAVLRRCRARPASNAESRTITAGELEIDLDGRRVLRNGVAVDLTPIEFRLLLALARRPGQLVSHDQLLNEVWGPQYTDCPHYVRLYMRYLRVKIEDDPHAPKTLVSEWGMGYRFQPREPKPSPRRMPVDRGPHVARQRHGATSRNGVGDRWFSSARHTASP